jgi:hypothetical protein
VSGSPVHARAPSAASDPAPRDVAGVHPYVGVPAVDELDERRPATDLDRRSRRQPARTGDPIGDRPRRDPGRDPVGAHHQDHGEGDQQTDPNLGAP